MCLLMLSCQQKFLIYGCGLQKSNIVSYIKCFLKVFSLNEKGELLCIVVEDVFLVIVFSINIIDIFNI